jgi:uncharacterized protein YbaR (Trm112 family)
MSHPQDANPLDPALLALLRCPLTRSPLRQEGAELIGEVGGLRYPIRDGIAMLLADEAKMPQGIATLDEFKAKFKDLIPA